MRRAEADGMPMLRPRLICGPQPRLGLNRPQPGLASRHGFGHKAMCPMAPSTDSVNVRLFRRRAGALNANHPVYNAFNSQLHELKDLYRRKPDERSRYQLVRHEQRMAQWLQQPAQQA